MNIKQIVDEPRRGCGYRKEGGMYLVSGGGAAPCGKLPLEMTVCPCCAQGIKPARGWTWVDAYRLFEDMRCEQEPCGWCPLSSQHLYDLGHSMMGLIWIGGKHYPTSTEFALEAARMGISRRITAIPKDFVIGETRVLLAHRRVISEIEDCTGCEGVGHVEGQTCPECAGVGRVEIWKPGIFWAYKPERIEYVVKPDDTAEKLERLEKRGIALVRLIRTDRVLELEL